MLLWVNRTVSSLDPARRLNPDYQTRRTAGQPFRGGPQKALSRCNKP